MNAGVAIKAKVGEVIEVGVGVGVEVVAGRGAQAATEASRRKVIKSPGRLSGDLILHHRLTEN
jgi:hypothetical protein